jgi:hypothetical protein
LGLHYLSQQKYGDIVNPETDEKAHGVIEAPFLSSHFPKMLALLPAAADANRVVELFSDKPLGRQTPYQPHDGEVVVLHDNIPFVVGPVFRERFIIKDLLSALALNR